MKKLTLSLLSLLLATSAFSQFYIRVSAGYNLPAASQQLGVSTNYKYDPNAGYSTTSKGVYGSFGSGFVAHMAVGGSFKNGLLGYDVDFGYLKGKGFDIVDMNENAAYISTYTTSMQSTSIQISPALTFTAGTGNFRPFARLGPTIGISKLTSEETDYDAYYNYTDVQEYEYKGGINIGLKGVVGCSYQLNDKMQLYVEADFVSLAYAPKERTMTRNDQNGVDNLPTTDPKIVNIEYEKEETSETVYGTPDVRPTFPMSSVGFQGGVKFTF